MIVLYGLPVPPTSNHQYVTIRRGGKTVHVASAELKAFTRMMNEWRLENLDHVRQAKEKLKWWASFGQKLEVKMYVAMSRKRLLLKDSEKSQKMDVSNRIKAIHDCVAQMLDVDDSEFWRVSAEKVETMEGEEECVMMTIAPMYRRSLATVREEKAKRMAGLSSSP